MKKNVLKVTLVIAFTFFAGYNVYNFQKTDVMSDLALANVEALASSREGGSPCGGPKSEITSNCQSQNTSNCKDLSGCQ